MIPAPAFDLPPKKASVLRKAQRLEVWTLVYLISAAVFIGLTMGSSQAMRTTFFEDMLSVLPAATFLVCSRIARRPPNERFTPPFRACSSDAPS